MRAMQIIEWEKPLEAREYPDPEPTGEEVLLRVEAAGVCHSDVHIWDGYFDSGGARRISLESRGVHLPFTMGHEIAGQVAAPDAVKRVVKATDGGAAAAIDFVGSPKTMEFGVNVLRKGGKLVMVGLYGGPEGTSRSRSGWQGPTDPD